MYWKKVQKTPFFFELDAKNFNSPCNLREDGSEDKTSKPTEKQFVS